VGYHADSLTITPSTGVPTTVRLQGTLDSDSTTTPPISGQVYVADSGNNRVQIFSGDGAYQGQFGSSIFFLPTGIAASSSNVFVNAGDSSCQVDVFDGIGDSLLQFGLCGGIGGPGYLEINGTSAADALGDVWVTNQDGYIQQFDSLGHLLSIFCTSRLADVPDCPLASGLGPDIYPYAIALDQSGNIYVTVTLGPTSPLIAKFDSTGKYLFSFGSAGSGDGQLKEPFGIAVASNGDIYVSDNVNNRMEIFDASGNYLSQFGKYGKGETDFSGPQGLALDAAGNLYVADTGNNRVVKYDSHGVYLSLLAPFGDGNGQLYAPLAVAIAP
jgi:DNA-binding beta-propeller fold protein YncE